MVTPDVGEDERALLSLHWDIEEVEPIPCYHKYQSRGQETSQFPEGLQQDMLRWKQTCTKFNAWKFLDYDRILFMDSDMIVLHPIDDAFLYSNASLVAAPECFPPDTFNSGFMILSPSLKTFHSLVTAGHEKGSAEGGDQGILNNYFCPNWFFVNDNDPHCGRLPWTYNVEAQYYETYKSYRKLYDMEPMKVIHYINDGKPWKTLMFDLNYDKVTKTEMIEALASQSYVASHMYWRYCFLRATGMKPPERSIYYERWEDVLERRGAFRSLDEPFFDHGGKKIGIEGEIQIQEKSQKKNQNRIPKPPIEIASKLDTVGVMTETKGGTRRLKKKGGTNQFPTSKSRGTEGRRKRRKGGRKGG
jgi:lipopolysaccharide biosynthesis glycosyltransferase